MNFELLRDNVNANPEYYGLTAAIFIFYFNPLLFFSIIFVFTFYGIYTNVVADFQFDIKINSYKKMRQKSRANLLDVIPNFDKPLFTQDAVTHSKDE